MIDLGPFIRDVPDFPKKGITFKDITPLLGDAHALAAAIDRLVSPWYGKGITKVVGIESRGFILAPVVALKLGVGFVPMRKPGKLPWRAISQSYGLEYGSDTIEIHEDSLGKADQVLLVDDVLATGGTMGAALSLVRRQGATPAGAAFLIDLAFLGGSQKLGVPVTAVLSY
jgi:adenine phosphoribosyltransferase